MADYFYSFVGVPFAKVFADVDSYAEVFGVDVYHYFAVDVDDVVYGFWFNDGVCSAVAVVN